MTLFFVAIAFSLGFYAGVKWMALGLRALVDEGSVSLNPKKTDR